MCKHSVQNRLRFLTFFAMIALVAGFWPPLSEAKKSPRYRQKATNLKTLAVFVPADANPMRASKFGVIALVPARMRGFFVAVAGIGTAGDGTVFRLTVSGRLTVLHEFTGKDGIGAMMEFLPGDDGNFYGTTTNGGAFGKGVFFRLTPSGKLTVLHSFQAQDHNAGAPSFILHQGKSFYAVTNSDGQSGASLAYKITQSGVFTVLHQFRRNENITAFSQGQDGNFFGTTFLGAPSENSTLFQLTPSGRFTLLHLFTQQETDGDGPYQIVQGNDGNFYGISQGMETLFRVTPDGKFWVLSATSQCSSDGSCPNGILEGRDSALYGTTESGGSGDNGTIFRVTKTGKFTLLHTFRDIQKDSYSDGSDLDTFFQGRDGNFYGTTDTGGSAGEGTFFRLTPSGKFTTLCAIGSSSMPASPKHSIRLMLQASDGSWYGLTDDNGDSRKSERLWRIMLQE